MRKILCILCTCFLLGCKDSSMSMRPGKDTGNAIPPDTVFEAFSGKPIWSLYIISNKEIVFMPGDREKLSFPYAKGIQSGSGITLYRSANGKDSMELSVIAAPCISEMGEVIQPYCTELKINGTELTGCGIDH